ncbi:MAG: membrane protein insertase YidC [Deltaproteobacteria bacterium]|nr:MAG: membrane protein insertase YidC [Deltaproteobacteria bacterium]
MNNENRNLILALVLMTAVWFGFSILFPAKPPQPAQNAPAPAAAAPQPAAAIEPPPASVPAAAPVAPVIATAREIVVETARYRAVLSTVGARLVSMELKDYRVSTAADAGSVPLVKSPSTRYATLRTTGGDGLVLHADAPFAVDAADRSIAVPAGGERRLTFRHVTAGGAEIVKELTFYGDRYTIDSAVTVRNSSPAPLHGSLNMAMAQQWDDSHKDSYSFAGPAALVGDKLEQVDVDDLGKGAKGFGKEVVWSSLQSKYFMTAAVPLAAAAEKLQIVLNGDVLESIFVTPAFALQPGESRRFDYLLFFGPKDPDLLKAAGHGLDLAINFGWFDLLAQPLFLVLTFFNGFLNNFGWSIILLTVILKLFFWPLTHKSYASMKAMQKLQPEMQKLRDKFKNDKERLNRELMELYKKHSVNPLGGCLPMLVQIPVFFALYKVLLEAIALRHAPFMLWITDLSAKDPYYITPLLMGASMFVQQKMTPTSMDPMQAKIFLFMPVIFTFLFLNFPSGLVIYWLVNNLLTIAQQYYINRTLT